MTLTDPDLAALLMAAGARLSGFAYPSEPDAEIGICLDVDELEPLADLLAAYERDLIDLDQPSVRFFSRFLVELLREEREAADYVRRERAWLAEVIRRGGEPT